MQISYDFILRITWFAADKWRTKGAMFGEPEMVSSIRQEQVILPRLDMKDHRYYVSNYTIQYL